MAKCTQCNNNEATRGLLCEDCIQQNKVRSKSQMEALRAELKIPTSAPAEKPPSAGVPVAEPEIEETPQDRLKILLMVFSSPRAAFFSVSRYVRMQEALIAASMMLVSNAVYVFGTQRQAPKGLLIILLLAGVLWFLIQAVIAAVFNFGARLFGKRLPFWCVFNLIGVALFPYAIIHCLFNIVAIRADSLNPGLALAATLVLVGAFVASLVLILYGLRVIPSEDDIQELLAGGGAPATQTQTQTKESAPVEEVKTSTTPEAESAEAKPGV